MKIYDCFTFYNEFDLLEIRLKELYDLVDHFVIVESNQTFTGKYKPWNFDLSRYPQYADKIIYVQVTDMPNTGNPWDNERHQRNSIVQGLVDADEDDIVIVSDADEILRPSAIQQLKNSDQTIFAFRMALFNFKFNYMRKTPGEYDIWAMACRRGVLDTITPDTLRLMRFQFMNASYGFANDGIELIEHAGWHFGYLGDNEHLRDKAQNFSHQEVNTTEFLNSIDVDTSIAMRREWNRNNPAEYCIVELDDYFPRALLDSQDRYSNYILSNIENKVKDILPHE